VKALEILDLSPDEMKLVGYVEHPDGSANWKDTDHRWDIEIKDKEAIHLVKAEAQRFQGWPVSMHEQIFDLTNQMGIKLDEKEEKKEELEPDA
jgi:hypothetical protein